MQEPIPTRIVTEASQIKIMIETFFFQLLEFRNGRMSYVILTMLQEMFGSEIMCWLCL